jgi:hypothetical protein
VKVIRKACPWDLQLREAAYSRLATRADYVSRLKSLGDSTVELGYNIMKGTECFVSL